MAIEHLSDKELIHLQKYMFEKDMDSLKDGAKKAGIPLSDFLKQLAELHKAFKHNQTEYFRLKDPDDTGVPPRVKPKDPEPKDPGIFQRLKTALGMNASTN